jgi:hypothetical protein
VSDHRTYGQTRNCKGCKFWSEMIARAIGGGPVQAMCLAQGGPYSSVYTTASTTCASYQPGYDGAVDQPGGYDDSDFDEDVEQDDEREPEPVRACEHGQPFDDGPCERCEEYARDCERAFGP